MSVKPKTALEVGDRVSWIARGKGARCDGVNGQRVYGTIQRFMPGPFPGDPDDASMKTEHKSMFDGSIVSTSKLRKEPKA